MTQGALFQPGGGHEVNPDDKQEAPRKILPAIFLSAPQKSSPLQQSQKRDDVSE